MPITFLTLWKERSLLKYAFQRHGFAPLKHLIARIWSKIPKTENLETYNTETGDRILVISDDLIAGSFITVQRYPKPVKNGAAASGTLEGISRSSWDTIYEIMTTKSKFSIFIESDGQITEYQNCDGGWDGSNTISWDCEDVKTYDI